MVEILDGVGSSSWITFIKLIVNGFLAVRQQCTKLFLLVELALGVCKYPCFQQAPDVLEALKSRFKLELSTKEFVNHVMELVDFSLASVRTYQYDVFQKLTNGVLY